MGSQQWQRIKLGNDLCDRFVLQSDEFKTDLGGRGLVMLDHQASRN